MEICDSLITRAVGDDTVIDEFLLPDNVRHDTSDRQESTRGNLRIKAPKARNVIAWANGPGQVKL